MKRVRDEPETLDTLEAELKQKEGTLALLKKDLTALRRRVTTARKRVAMEADLQDVLSDAHAKLYLARSAAQRAVIRASALAMEGAQPGLVRYAIGMRLDNGAVTWEFRKWADYYTYITPGSPATVYSVKDKEYEGWHFGGDWHDQKPTLSELFAARCNEVTELIKSGRGRGY
jgi:hypothetical protein